MNLHLCALVSADVSQRSSTVAMLVFVLLAKTPAAQSAPLRLSVVSAAAQTQSGTTVIRNVRVFDGERVLQHRGVLIANGEIRQIGGARMRAPGVTVVDGRNRTLLPALFDTHIHVAGNPEPALRQMAALGVTTALDMFAGTQVLNAKQRIESTDPPDMADLRSSGLGAVGPGSALSTMMQRPLPTVTAVEDADAWVSDRLAEGSDYIKIIYDPREGGPLSLDIVSAIVHAAHARRKLVIVHTLDEQAAREAIAAGADGLAHLFLGDAVSATFGAFAAAHHVFVIPTLVTLHGLCGNPEGRALVEDRLLAPYVPPSQRQASDKKPDPSRQHLCAAIRPTLQQLLDAGVPILAGTDVGMATGQLLGVVAYGATLHLELKLLVDEGLTPVQALSAATAAAADAFRLTDRGRIRQGRRADLLLVDGDPTRDITATRRIVNVWKRGVPVHRQPAQ
jgi:imidazolonepropionase-like amidohydrolase